MKTFYAILITLIIFYSSCTTNKKESSKCCNVKYSNSTKIESKIKSKEVVVSGRTFNCKNNGILGDATITLDGDFGKYETTAGKDGKFAFYNIPSGTYYLDVKKEGFCKIKHKEVKFDAGNVVEIVAYLTKL